MNVRIEKKDGCGSKVLKTSIISVSNNEEQTLKERSTKGAVPKKDIRPMEKRGKDKCESS